MVEKPNDMEGGEDTVADKHVETADYLIVPKKNFFKNSSWLWAWINPSLSLLLAIYFTHTSIYRGGPYGILSRCGGRGRRIT